MPLLRSWQLIEAGCPLHHTIAAPFQGNSSAE